MHTSVAWFSSFAELYVTYAFFARILVDIKLGISCTYTREDGLLFKDLRICIPDSSLRLQIISEIHNKGHVGSDHTLQLVSHTYF